MDYHRIYTCVSLLPHLNALVAISKSFFTSQMPFLCSPNSVKALKSQDQYCICLHF